jgi:hypothetical protein
VVEEVQDLLVHQEVEEVEEQEDIEHLFQVEQN